MSVDQTDRVDAVGIEKTSGYVILTISDHLGWEDEEEHLLILQEKLNTYVQFVEGGQLLETLPTAEGRQVVVEIVFREALPTSAKDFLAKVRPVLEGAGMRVRSRVQLSKTGLS